MKRGSRKASKRQSRFDRDVGPMQFSVLCKMIADRRKQLDKAELRAHRRGNFDIVYAYTDGIDNPEIADNSESVWQEFERPTTMRTHAEIKADMENALIDFEMSAPLEKQ